jgi:hypothetical protein
MPVDLTYYHKRHNDRLQDATGIAEALIDKLEDIWCCYDCSITKSIPFSDEPRGLVVIYADIIQAVMFSSGYWCTYTVRKKGDDYILAMKVTKMTDEEAVENIMPDDEDDEEDPNGMD